MIKRSLNSHSKKRKYLLQITLHTMHLGFWFLLIFTQFSCKSKKQETLADNEYYACSMDPQVLEKQPGLCPICKMPLAKITLDKDQMHVVKLNAEQIKLANIKVSSVGKSLIGKETVLSGAFTINQNQTQQISTRIAGRIDKLYHKVVGEKISVGEPIYDLYSRDFLLAQEEYIINSNIKVVNNVDMSLSAKNKLLLWGMTLEQIDELAKTRKPNVTFTVLSKASGTITEIPVREGESVGEGTTIFKLADLSSLWVEAQLYSNELNLLQEGAKVQVIPDAFPDEVVEGVVTFANPELQNDSKINLIRVIVNNARGKFSPGMQANVVLHSQEKKAITLPADAVLRDAHSSVVWIQNSEGGFEPRSVETGMENKFQLEITSGLNVGERVVTSGAYLINSEYIFKIGMMPSETEGMHMGKH